MSAMGDLFTKQYTVLDASVTPRLHALGMPADACTPDWILRHPNDFRTLKSFDLAAGSDFLLAPTQSADSAGLRRRGLRADVRTFNRSLVELTRDAAQGHPVGGALGPIGLSEPTDFEEAVSLYAEQATAMEEVGVDCFFLESQNSMAECRAAVIAVRSVSEKPIVCSFAPTNTARSLQGEELAAVMVCLQDMNIEAFGINGCGNMGLITRVLTKLRRYAGIPLFLRPSGPSVLRGGIPHYSFRTEKITPYLPRFLSAGARIIGGDNGTDSDFIAAMRQSLDSADYPAFVPAETKPLAASPYRIVELTPRMKITDLEIDDEIVENASIAEETGTKLLNIQLRDDMDLDTLLEAQFSIRLPLAVHCEDEELLRRFLRLYNGKPVIL